MIDLLISFVLVFNGPQPTLIITLSLHDALPIYKRHYDHLQAAAVRLAVLLLAAMPLAAQQPRADLATARSGVILDAYSFGSGFAVDNVVEWPVPVTLSQHLGQQVIAELSPAFTCAPGASAS